MGSRMTPLIRNAVLICVAFLLVIYPLVLPEFYAALAIEAFAMSLFALSFNLMFGYSGMLSFGHATFYGIGAYTCALVLKHVGTSIALAFVSSLAVSFVAAILIGSVCVRFTKAYFIMLTVAFAEIVYVIGNKWVSVTGGDDGLVGVPVPTYHVPGLPAIDLLNIGTYYYFALVVVTVAICALYIITNSRFGHVMRAIRESPERAAFLGINVQRHRLLTYAIAGMFAGLAGALFVPFEGMVSLETLGFSRSADAIIMSILGGTRFFFGPIVGTIVFIIAKDLIQNFAEFWKLWMGVLFAATVMFMPGGVVGFISSLDLFGSRAFSLRKQQE